MKIKKIIAGCIIAFLGTTIFQIVEVEADSLWNGITPQESSFFVDTPAPQLAINDIVTILIEESTTATTVSDTEAELEDTLTGQIIRWFSVEGWDELYKIFLFDSPDIQAHRNNINNLPQWGMDIDNEFDGEGETIRTNNIIATVAARVVAIEPNGNVVLEGKRQITVNKEKTFLTITGVVSEQDVNSNNTVRSSLMADLQFSVDGKGILADINERGPLSKFMSFMR